MNPYNVLMKESKHSTEKAPENKSAQHELKGDGINEWLKRNRSLVLRQTPFWAQSTASIIAGLACLGIIAAFSFRIDEVVTASGQLEAETGNIEVKTPAGGKVARTYVKDGDRVTKGARIVTFDTRQAEEEKRTLLKLINLEENDARERIEILNQRERVISQKASTSEEIISELKVLVENGGFQRVQYLQQLDQLLELRSQVASLQLEKTRTRLEAEKSIGEMKSRLYRADLQIQYQNVLAPTSGIVFDSKAKEAGVIEAGSTILSIVPQNGLKARVFIPNKDIGFVKTDQKAQVRVDAFPFARYGELSGLVQSIGADALPPDEKASFYRFPVVIRLHESSVKKNGLEIPLQSGMAVTANLKLREKRIIELLSDMLSSQVDSIRSLRQEG